MERRWSECTTEGAFDIFLAELHSAKVQRLSFAIIRDILWTRHTCTCVAHTCASAKRNFLLGTKMFEKKIVNDDDDDRSNQKSWKRTERKPERTDGRFWSCQPRSHKNIPWSPTNERLETCVCVRVLERDRESWKDHARRSQFVLRVVSGRRRCADLVSCFVVLAPLELMIRMVIVNVHLWISNSRGR